MDGQRFDTLTRRLAAGASRRAVVRRLLGGAAAGALALVGRGAGATQECAHDEQPCGDVCIPQSSCCTGGKEGCGYGATCDYGQCVATSCGYGEKTCGYACIPESHCCTGGKEGCPTGKTCESGECVSGGGGGGGCQSNADCPDGICLVDHTCFTPSPSTCPGGHSNLACCRNAVRRACRHQGGNQAGHGHGGPRCRKLGFRRCAQKFGGA